MRAHVRTREREIYFVREIKKTYKRKTYKRKTYKKKVPLVG